jgi:hypothetical protein
VKFVGEVFVKKVSIIFGLLLMTTAVAAQWQSEDNKVPDTPDRKSLNGFGAHLIAVKDPRAFIQEWLKPEQPKIEPAKKIKAGEPLGIIVLFAGYKEVSGSCDSEVDYTIYKPDGSIFTQRLKQPLWKEAAPPKPNIQLGRAILAFQFQSGQPKGQYKIKAQVRDLNAGTTIDLETQIELKD